MMVGQRIGAVRSRSHRNPVLLARSRSPPCCRAVPRRRDRRQQLRDEPHRFPGNVKRGTIGDRVGAFRRRSCGFATPPDVVDCGSIR